MTTRRLSLVAAALSLGLTLLLSTSAPAAAQARHPEQSSAPPALPPDGYTYNPEGRRDPFVTLLRKGAGASAPGARRADGISGLSSNEVALKGTMVSHGQYVALVQGADGKTYLVHSNEQLLDGVVRAITATSMVIRQRVNDPLSLEKQRDVRKLLRSTDDVK